MRVHSIVFACLLQLALCSEFFAEPSLPSTLVSANAAASDLQSTANEASARNTMRSKKVNVGQKVAQMLYEDMSLGRQFEDMVAQMYYRGRVAGFVHLYNGQEAVSTGVLKAMRHDDFAVSTYRDHVHALSKGLSSREVMAELYGKATGCSKGRGGSMHMFSKQHNFVGGFAFIGEQIPVALGLAFSIAYRRQEMNDTSADQVVACFLGDGASNIGQFYEAMNMAAIARLPIIFVVENNNWAIGMAAYRSTAVPEIYKRGAPFGVPGVEVDGMDVLAVRSVAREAVRKARAGEGPTLIEALTYRFRGHSLADPDELRAPEEKAAWVARDPLTSFGEYMKRMGYATDASLKETQKRIRAVVDDAVKFAESSPEPDTKDVAKYIMTDDYPAGGFDEVDAKTMERYAEALKEELLMKEKKKKGDKTQPTPVQMLTRPLAVID